LAREPGERRDECSIDPAESLLGRTVRPKRGDVERNEYRVPEIRSRQSCTMTGMAADEPLRLRGRDLRSAARICAQAFADAPHIVHFFPEKTRRERDPAALFEMRIRYGLLYGEVYVTSRDLEGVAVWIPSERASMTMWKQIRAGGIRLYRSVDADAVARMTHVAEHNDRLRRQHVPGRHWFLSILAVDPAHQRQGHATRLVKGMLDRVDRKGIPCYAETTEPHVLPFYRRLGFEVGTESIVPGTDLTVWPLVRPPAA
jgi:GNAT superfamily N-acetyltransferase